MRPWISGGEFLGGWIGSVGGPPEITIGWTSEPPAVLRNWLGRVRLLYGVPFEYLVPEERLLPRESIRFFYVDRNWTDRLVDGAMSVGKTTTLEYAQHQAAQPAIKSSVDGEESTVRRQLRDGTTTGAATPSPGPPPDITGLLMRSALVSGWPGLEIRAFRQGVQLLLLRMDRLAPDLLLCLFSGIPTRVEVVQPAEEAHFGVTPAASSSVVSGFQVALRQVTGANAGTGVSPARSVDVPVRAANRQVLHVSKLREALEQALGPLTPAAFAVQLLQGTYRHAFEGSGAPSQTRRPRTTRGSARARSRSGGAAQPAAGQNQGPLIVPLAALTNDSSTSVLATPGSSARRRRSRNTR